jgi:hypothetical protein
MKDLRASLAYAEPPGIPIEGICAVCREPKDFVISQALYQMTDIMRSERNTPNAKKTAAEDR